MELPDWDVNEHVETRGDTRDFSIGNGMWWQNSFVPSIGYGFGFVEDFSRSDGEYYGYVEYPFNLIYEIK